jgi:hypothetical protein
METVLDLVTLFGIHAANAKNVEDYQRTHEFEYRPK